MRYEQFNKALLELREEYHKNGTIDDSNKKLDEMIKLLTMNFYDSKMGTSFLDLEYLKQIALEKYGNEGEIASALKESFQTMAMDEMFVDKNGKHIFGESPSLYLDENENSFALKLISIMGRFSFNSIIEKNNIDDFDVINEMFGHFVRENFRNNKEDAQYMTPKEIVDPFVQMIISEIKRDERLEKKLFSNDPFVIMDPTCGVGTLMIEVLRGLIHYIESTNKPESLKRRTIQKLRETSLIGQDKVNRMVTFSKINAMFMGCSFDNIFNGNSILPGSQLDRYTGMVDIIFTNPPFGANFEKFELNVGNYPIIQHLDNETYSSEFLLLDRAVNLLAEGGLLAIVLPDGVVSSKGMPAEFREKLMGNVNILSVTELPSETFAQAGTRTKTVVLVLKKSAPDDSIFMSICEDIGFIVKNKKGVPTKQIVGENQLIDISNNYISSIAEERKRRTRVISTAPSCVLLNKKDLVEYYLTPSFYDAERISINNIINDDENRDFEYKSLSEVAILDSKNKSRKKLMVNDEVRHISLLHVNSKQFTIDLQEVLEFEPISKGTECFEGEVLVSKLNPRIKRMVVVPHYDKQLVCSNEFEILVPQKGYNSYELLLMLDSPMVLKQINSLTSGTSSSHSRIKREQLSAIKIPVPKTEDARNSLRKNALKFENAIRKAYESQTEINELSKIFE